MAERALDPLPPVLERHEVTITYLEQLAPPVGVPPARPSGKFALMRVDDPPLSYYRYLFDVIGTPHRWISRRYLSDADLVAKIHAETCEIYVLYSDGWPAGFVELALPPNGGEGGDVGIQFFGLVPEVQGQRIGPWLMHETVRMIWRRAPRRVFIETCTLDSPAALRLYQRMGFSVYDQGKGVVEWRG